MRFFSLCFALLLVLAPAIFGLQEGDAINKGSRSRLVSKLRREVVTAKSGDAAPFRRHTLQVKRGEKAGVEQEKKEEKLLMLVESGQGHEKSDEKEVRALLESKEDKADKAFEEEAEMEWADDEDEDEEEEDEDEEDRRAKVEDEDDWEEEEEEEDDDDDVAPAILEDESAGGIIIVEGDDMESLAKALKEAGATDQDIEEIIEEEAAFEELEEELEAEFGGVDEAEAEAAGWEAGTDVAEKAMKQKGAEDGENDDILDEEDEEDEEDEDMLDEEDEEDEEDEDMLDDEDEDMLDEEDEEDEDMLDEEDEDMLDEEDEEDEEVLDEDEDEEAVAASSKEAFPAEEPMSVEAASAGVEGGPEEKISSSSSRAGFVWALSLIGGLVVLVAAVWKTVARRSSSDFYSMPNATAYGSDASSQEQPFGLDAEASLTQHYGQYRRVTAHGQESR